MRTRLAILLLFSVVLLGIALGVLLSNSLENGILIGMTGGLSVVIITLCGLMMKSSKKAEAQSAELRGMVMSLTTALFSALDAKSPWTRGHSIRVRMYAEQIARKMGLPEDEITNLGLASLLHDIGKLGTYDYLLEKPDGLTAEEYAIVKQHPAHGVNILENVKQLRDVIPIIAHHHERYDGKGYPRGMKGKEIPIGARILHVADTYEAITDDRPYRPARGCRVAAEELRRNSGTQFDPAVVEAFLSVLGEDSDPDYAKPLFQMPPNGSVN